MSKVKSASISEFMLNVKCKMSNVKNGFTFIEILLSIVIIVAMTSVAVPIYQSFQVRNDLDIAVNTIAQTIRRAQVLAQANDGDSNWGIKIQAGSIVLFRGDSYLSKDSGYDEIFDLASSIDSSTGLGEIIFTKFTGEPDNTGDIILTSTINETRTMTINEKGMIDF